ncbi:MAG: hypothetical protein AAF447_13285 [Myxococcota bacterium]
MFFEIAGHHALARTASARARAALGKTRDAAAGRDVSLDAVLSGGDADATSAPPV